MEVIRIGKIREEKVKKTEKSVIPQNFGMVGSERELVKLLQPEYLLRLT